MENYKLGQEIGVSVQALYDRGINLEHGAIIPDYQNGAMAYYDLYNEHDELACCDGERCQITQVGSDFVCFLNENGLRDAAFKLTLEEAETACFKLRSQK